MRSALSLMQQSLFQGPPETDVFSILVSLSIAMALGLIISQVYKLTYHGISSELSFMNTLVLLAPIVTLVMLFIRGDLVLSLGLIGSLSIIRFRTPIKDSRDMIFLFWTIAVGLGAGTYNWTTVILASMVLTLLVFALFFCRYGRSRYDDYILVCNGSREVPFEQISRILRPVTRQAVLRSLESTGDAWETVLELRVPVSRSAGLHETVAALRQSEGIHKVSLLAPRLDLPV